ncbi:MAG: hypothetical protein OHK93_005879 [Ramalina farinacea]|uniref:Carrier domain-containing protein n=1 Tax=Ramalina farinacea TaxID=258253 RepID=A0AA43TWA9_9LECA|nr:hypothetical protein [Ramalina farinacea]
MLSIYGSSEMGELPQMIPADDCRTLDWNHRLFKNLLGAHVCHQSGNLYEMVLSKTSTTMEYQPRFAIFPELSEFHSRDIFSPHPTEPDLCSYEGQLDDLIVLSNGLKVNPLCFERIVTSDPRISSALMAGTQRLQSALLVELADSSHLDIAGRAHIIEDIWPLVQKANATCPAQAEVLKTHILIASPGKPFGRAAKETVQRAFTLKLYSKELDDLYADADQSPNMSPYEAMGEEELSGLLLREILNIIGWRRIQTDVSFFEREMDSLQAVALSRRLRHLFCSDIVPSTIYSNSTAKLLAEAVRKILSHEKPANDDQERLDEEAITKTFETSRNHFAANTKSLFPREAQDSVSNSLASVSSLASLAAASPLRPNIIYVSSVAAGRNYSPSPYRKKSQRLQAWPTVMDMVKANTLQNASSTTALDDTNYQSLYFALDKFAVLHTTSEVDGVKRMGSELGAQLTAFGHVATNIGHIQRRPTRGCAHGY